MLLTILALSLCAQPAAVESPTATVQWVAVVAEPPTSTPHTRLYRVTTQAGKPSVAEPIDPNPPRPPTVVQEVQGTRLSPATWCLTNDPKAVIFGLAVVINGLMYSTVYGQPEIVYRAVPGCALAVDVQAFNPASPPTRVGALILTQ